MISFLSFILQKIDLRRIGYTNGVKVIVERSRIKILGYGIAVDTAAQKVEEYISGLDRDIRKGYSDTAGKSIYVYYNMMIYRSLCWFKTF